MHTDLQSALMAYGAQALAGAAGVGPDRAAALFPAPDDAPNNVVRTVTENARTLKFKSSGFEEQ